MNKNKSIELYSKYISREKGDSSLSKLTTINEEIAYDGRHKNFWRKELKKFVPLWSKEYDEYDEKQGADLLKKVLDAEPTKGINGHWSYDVARHNNMYQLYKKLLTAVDKNKEKSVKEETEDLTEMLAGNEGMKKGVGKIGQFFHDWSMKRKKRAEIIKKNEDSNDYNDHIDAVKTKREREADWKKSELAHKIEIERIELDAKKQLAALERAKKLATTQQELSDIQLEIELLRKRSTLELAKKKLQSQIEIQNIAHQRQVLNTKRKLNTPSISDKKVIPLTKTEVIASPLIKKIPTENKPKTLTPTYKPLELPKLEAPVTKHIEHSKLDKGKNVEWKPKPAVAPKSTAAPKPVVAPKSTAAPKPVVKPKITAAAASLKPNSGPADKAPPIISKSNDKPVVPSTTQYPSTQYIGSKGVGVWSKTEKQLIKNKSARALKDRPHIWVDSKNNTYYPAHVGPDKHEVIIKRDGSNGTLKLFTSFNEFKKSNPHLFKLNENVEIVEDVVKFVENWFNNKE